MTINDNMIIMNVCISAVFYYTQKEHYLSFTMKNNYWWKNHGYLCYNVCSNGAAGGDEDTNNNDGSGTPLIDGTLSVDEGSAAVSLQHCFVTFVVSIKQTHSYKITLSLYNFFQEIETFHASLNMLLIVSVLNKCTYLFVQFLWYISSIFLYF